MTTDWNEHRRTLAEAQAWVLARLPLGNPAVALRSSELGAQLTEYPNQWFHRPQNGLEIEKLIALRRQLLQGQEAESLAKGRILCAFAGWDTQMGEGVSASDGVIDDAYLPPWDCWFAVFQLAEYGGTGQVLLAWIPDELVANVQNAMEVAATEPIHWLDEAFMAVSGTDQALMTQLNKELNG